MARKILMAFFVVTLCGIAYAHEFWLQPLKFVYQVNELMKISFRVGEQFVGEVWDLGKHRVERLELHNEGNVVDLKDKVGQDENFAVKATLEQEGTHLLVMSSNNAFIELEAEKFNAYLQEDALDEAYGYRRKNGQLDKPGKEHYMRNAKLLVQVGNKRNDTFKKEVGLPLEIVPMQNPYALKVGDRVSFKVLFKGKPLFGAKVCVWNRHNNTTSVQNIFSQQNGVVETHISNKGSWMVSVVKMVPTDEGEADWQSYWGSLVFGIE